MRLIVAGCLIVAAGFGIAASGAAGSATALNVTITPRTGGPKTRFLVRFRAPARTGILGIQERRYQIEASGKGTGCAQSKSSSVPATTKGQRVSVRLSGPWCAATYHGKLVETIGPYCRPGQPCPEFATQIRTIAPFRFMVVQSSGISATS